MTKLEPTGPNEGQIRYWNEQAGPGWVKAREGLDSQIGGLGRIGIERAAPQPGEAVLDVGCGCGDSALALAERVGASGRVVGVDISTPMLEEARRRAAEAGLEQLSFVNADAQTHALEPAAFDLAFSRFGVMFFADPGAASANLLRALRPGGRVAFVCWQPLARNPWLRVPLETVARFVTLPPPAAPDAPGPFAFGDAARVTGLLSGAGFAEVDAEGVPERIGIGGRAGLEGAAKFMMQMGPAAGALREAGVDDPAELAKIERALVEAFEPHASADGVWMDCAIWIYRARRPA